MHPKTLQDAIEYDDIGAALGLLRDNNVPLSTRNIQGEDAVQYFVHHGKKCIREGQRRIRLVNYFLHFGWSLDDPVELGRTLLHCAVITDDMPLFHHLLEKTSASIDIKDNEGCTPLYLACQLGRQDMVGYLLQKGADKTCTDKAGNTLLHTAAKHGHQALISLLLGQGLQVNIRNRFKETALHQCLEHPNAPLLVAKLLEAGADRNAQDAQGNTPLHFVVSENEAMQLPVLEQLCQAGASLNIKNHLGQTPLYKACVHYMDDGVSEERTEVLEAMISLLMAHPNVEYNHIGPLPYPLTVVMAEDLKFLAQLRGLGVLEYRTPQMSEKKVSADNVLGVDCFKMVFPAVIKKVHTLEMGVAFLEAMQGGQAAYLSIASSFLKAEGVSCEQRKALEKLLGLCKQEIEAGQVAYLQATALLSPHEFVLLEDALFSFDVVGVIYEQIRDHFRSMRRPWLMERTLRALGETVGLLKPHYSLVELLHADPTGSVSEQVRAAFEGIEVCKEPWYGLLAPEIQKSVCKTMGVVHPLSSVSPVVLVKRHSAKTGVRFEEQNPEYSINCAPQK